MSPDRGWDEIVTLESFICKKQRMHLQSRGIFFDILLVLLAIVLVYPVQLLAQNQLQSKDDVINTASNLQEIKPIPISLTTSGGVSLGGYQAGYLYYFTEIIKRNPQLFDPKVITGSSAGTLNSILAIIALGNEPEDEPEQSLFFKMWTGFTHNELIDTENAPPMALSSRRAINSLADQMTKAWQKGLSKDLDIVVGVTVTRVEGRSVDVSGDFSIPRQEEKFVFRVQGQGVGRAPQVSNYIDHNYSIKHPILPFSGPTDKESTRAKRDFGIIKQLMFASSAFPLVFPPQEIDYCMTSLNLDDSIKVDTLRGCSKAKFTSKFVDGSMFDRNPLRLAYKIAQSGLQKDAEGKLTWKNRPNIKDNRLSEDLKFIYLDAGYSSYPHPIEEKATHRVGALFPTFGAYSKGFVKSAQAKEMYTLIDDNPQFKDRIILTTRYLPAVSELFLNFFGFFDRKFRIFDFYLGMHDARRNLSNLIKIFDEQNGYKTDYVLPEETTSLKNNKSWAPYYCLRGMLDGEDKYLEACESEKLQDFRILLKVSLDRLYSHCSHLKYDKNIDHELCKRAMMKEHPPQIPGMPIDVDLLEDNAWQREDKESQLKHTLRLLKEYNFWFEDLGLDRDDGWLAMSEIREFLSGSLDIFAKQLPLVERVVLRTFGKPALNFFVYQPPQTILYLGIGESNEVGFSATGAGVLSRWLRVNPALQFRGIVKEHPSNTLIITPLLGFELEIPQLSNPMLQIRLGGRIGYQVSSGDKYLGRNCKMNDFDEDSAQCSAPVGQLMFAFILYERFRIQGVAVWFPYFLPPMSNTWRSEWNGFIQLGWQWLSPF